MSNVDRVLALSYPPRCSADPLRASRQGHLHRPPPTSGCVERDYRQELKAGSIQADAKVAESRSAVPLAKVGRESWPRSSG